MDVWVPSLNPEPQQTLPAMPERVLELRRGGVRLPSRLLDDIYWLGRHSERCDNIARLVRAGLERSGFEASPDAPNACQAFWRRCSGSRSFRPRLRRSPRAVRRARSKQCCSA
jgi:hypothetical protein